MLLSLFCCCYNWYCYYYFSYIWLIVVAIFITIDIAQNTVSFVSVTASHNAILLFIKYEEMHHSPELSLTFNNFQLTEIIFIWYCTMLYFSSDCIFCLISQMSSWWGEWDIWADSSIAAGKTTWYRSRSMEADARCR